MCSVCYREAAEEQLQNFQDELEAAPGGMTEEVRSVLQQIQDAPREPRAERQSQVRPRTRSRGPVQ